MKPLDPRLLTHARSSRGFLVACVALGVATAVLVLAQAFLLADLITGAFQRGLGLADLTTPMVALAAVVTTRAVLAWATEAAAHGASAAVKSQLRTRLLAQVVRLGPGWLAGERTGEIATLATRGIDALDDYFARYLPQLALACIVPPTVVAVLLTQDWLAAAIVAATLPLVPVFMILVGLATRRQMNRQWRSLTVLAGHFLDVVAGLPTLKVFGRAKAQAAKVRAVTDEHRRATMGTLRIAFLSAMVLELVATVSVALVAVSVGLRLVDGGIDLRTALVVLVLAPEAYWPLRQVGTHYHASVEGLTALDRVAAVLDLEPARSGERRDVPDLRRAVLRIDGLTVRYPGRRDPALDRLTMSIEPGERVAVVGPSGAGKSTLLAVLLGFVPPTKGGVRVETAQGSDDLADLDPVAVRAQLAWVPQRPHLLAASVADNIRLAVPSADEAAVRRAARLANAEEFVDGLPQGFATLLGEDGAGLSAGQRQRLALARAFLKDAPVLLLDEPTANLDPDSETAVAEAVARLSAGRTVVVVAHRPALVLGADRVVELAPAPVPA